MSNEDFTFSLGEFESSFPRAATFLTEFGVQPEILPLLNQSSSMACTILTRLEQSIESHLAKTDSFNYYNNVYQEFADGFSALIEGFGVDASKVETVQLVDTVVAETGVSEAEINARVAFDGLNYEEYSHNADHAWINNLKTHLTSFKNNPSNEEKGALFERFSALEDKDGFIRSCLSNHDFTKFKNLDEAFEHYDKSQLRKAITTHLKLKKVKLPPKFFTEASLELLQGFDTALKDSFNSAGLVNQLKGQLKTNKSLQLKVFFK